MSNQLRIIGGLWRGRKLKFPDVPGLRPTPDRVRETLFNWLQYDIIGARCIDLFAGSGALGLEAASREAALVVQVESNARAYLALKENLQMLSAGERVSVVRADVMRFLAGKSQAFDLVFLDPPFGKGWVAPVCRALEENGWLAETAKIYIEAEAGLAITDLPSKWRQLKAGKAGEVGYHLYLRTRGDDDGKSPSSDRAGGDSPTPCFWPKDAQIQL